MLHNFPTDSPKAGSKFLRRVHSRHGSRRRRRTNAPLAVERMEERTLLSTFSVTNTNDSGSGSLRQAILDNNSDTANTAADTIDFNIPGTGVQTIQPLSQLPIITHPVVIDGYSQPGSKPNDLATGDDAVLSIELDGSSAGGGGRGVGLRWGQQGDGTCRESLSVLRDLPDECGRQRHRGQFHRHLPHRRTVPRKLPGCGRG